MIVWRYIHNKLPTNDNLKIRGLSFPSLCSLCLSHCENSTHLFFECKFAKNIWSWFAGISQFGRPINCLEDCRNLLLQSWCPQSKVVLQASIACIFHQIWLTRNRSRFEDLSANWKSCVGFVTTHAKIVGLNTRRISNSAIKNFVMLKSFGISIHPKKQTTTIEVLWSPPLAGWMKCNTDGVSILNGAACGVICRDHHANHLFSLCDYIGSESADFAELVAAILALEEAKKRNISKLWLETDSMFVVNAFKDCSRVPWKLRSRWLVCWNYSVKINFMVTHIFREANFCADSLANLGLHFKAFRIFNYVHEDIQRDFLLDKLGTPRHRICT
ncbi:uncharacterized protein LOC131650935 [Vicia villosa]|uniref:uncharacterized protein LOC131650935 n=1 Tax=Vicia villosa TaxID=3911 RepID=UPI00273B7628|nr:uncharacterized protein LOC131650935 [Vicia villosa]